jgi:hypothetical protein
MWDKARCALLYSAEEEVLAKMLPDPVELPRTGAWRHCPAVHSRVLRRTGRRPHWPAARARVLQY